MWVQPHISMHGRRYNPHSPCTNSEGSPTLSVPPHFSIVWMNGSTFSFHTARAAFLSPPESALVRFRIQPDPMVLPACPRPTRPTPYTGPPCMCVPPRAYMPPRPTALPSRPSRPRLPPDPSPAHACMMHAAPHHRMRLPPMRPTPWRPRPTHCTPAFPVAPAGRPPPIIYMRGSPRVPARPAPAATCGPPLAVRGPPVPPILASRPVPARPLPLHGAPPP